MTAASSIGVAQHARCLSILQLEREIAAAERNNADADYIVALREILEERRSVGERETEPPPAPTTTKAGA